MTVGTYRNEECAGNQPAQAAPVDPERWRAEFIAEFLRRAMSTTTLKDDLKSIVAALSWPEMESARIVCDTLQIVLIEELGKIDQNIRNAANSIECHQCGKMVSAGGDWEPYCSEFCAELDGVTF